ncbi:MAG: glycosyltransferase [Sedimentisphaerales bacterium]|nr:glycosyltransferase [Sedimentisphaerales bacterium]
MIGITQHNKLICVVLVIDDLEYGGAQRQVVELANNMDADRFDVHVCTLSDYVPLGVHLRDSKHRLHSVVKKNKVDLTVVPRLARLLKSLNADIVHSYLFSSDIASRLAGRMAGTKVVIASERSANYPVKTRRALACRLTRSCVDLIIANSKTGAEFNSKTFGYPSSHYRVVYNGVNTERFKPQDKTFARKELGLSEKSNIIGIVAALKAAKNHSMILQAFKMVLDSYPDSQLLIVGDQLYGNVNLYGKLSLTDDYRERMNTLIDELGIRHRCTFSGNYKDVEHIYPACDITVLPSLNEGMPNVLLESMACGVPVIATNICDNPQIVKEGKVGFLVEVDNVKEMVDRINALLNNDNLRKSMGQQARNWVLEKFSTKQLARNTESVYMDILETKRKK